jgi:hypothetical protein
MNVPKRILVLSLVALLPLALAPASAHAGVCTGSDPDDDSQCIAVEEDLVHAVVCLQPTPHVCALFLGVTEVATPVDDGATRCYVHTDVTDPSNPAVTFWQETNGLTGGGAPTAQDYAAAAPGTPDEGTSGLQTTPTPDGDGGFIPADTQIDAGTFAADCAALA